MKNLFAAAVIGFTSDVSAQCGKDGAGCLPNFVDNLTVNVNPPTQQMILPGTYYPKQLNGPGNPYKGSMQFGSDFNTDVRTGYGDNDQWAWKQACCSGPTADLGNCNCGKTVRRCRDRAIMESHTETRYDAETAEVPTAEKKMRLMPTVVMTPEFTTVKVPVKAYVTEHRIEYRQHLATRPPSVVFQTHTPINPLVSDCSCYSPYCQCSGASACGCSFPACGCAPQTHELGTNFHTTGKNQTYVTSVPVKVPYQKEIIKYIDQKVALNRPQTVLRWQNVLTNGSRKVNVLRPTAVKSHIPSTVQECWNEQVNAP